MTAIESAIIRSLDALTEDHLPSDILARDSQIKDLRSYLSPATQGRKPLHVWIHGKPGTGKTTVARYVSSQLEQNTRVEVAHVNCWKSSTLFLVLQSIIDTLRIIVPDNANTVVKLHRIRTHLGTTPLVVILDELDKVEPKEQNSILYTLTEIDSVGLVVISSSRATLFSLEDRVRSRLNPATIGFDPYRTEDLRRILEARAKYALVPTSFTPETLEKIADFAIGDARVAIQTLRNAAQIAEIQGSRSISLDQVERGLGNAQKLKIKYTLGKLTEHHRMLYEIVESTGEMATGDLWAAYLQRCKENDHRPIADRTFNLYVNSLVTQNLLERERAPARGNVYILRIHS